MDKHIIEALTEEVARLKTALAVQNMGGSDEHRKLAEQLFKDQQDEIAILCIELTAIRKSRDEFQLENQKLKRRITALEKKLKG